MTVVEPEWAHQRPVGGEILHRASRSFMVASSFHLPDPGIEPWSPALQADSLLSEPPGNPKLGFPCGSAGKEFTRNVGDPGFIPGLGRSPGEENGNPLQYSCLYSPHVH